MMAVMGTPDIILNRVPDRKRSKRKRAITKCCLTVRRSIEKRPLCMSWSECCGCVMDFSATYDGAVLLWQL